MSHNPLGDVISCTLIYTLSNYAVYLEDLDLSFTGLSIQSTIAIKTLLASPDSQLKYLRLPGNKLGDDCICEICISLLKNTSLMSCNLSKNDISTLAGIAISKVLRANRTLKSINLSFSKISGTSIREISRSLMVNDSLLSLVMNSCSLNNTDSRDIGNMLAHNKTLQQLSITKNSITPKGLERMHYGLSKNNTLVHLALSGNLKIKLKHLEVLKGVSLPDVDVDIAKEDDFIRSKEAKESKLNHYLY